MKKIGVLIGALVAGGWFGLAGASLAPAAEVTVWQIGQFDQSSEEFGSSFGIRKVSMGRAMLDINGQHYTGTAYFPLPTSASNS